MKPRKLVLIFLILKYLIGLFARMGKWLWQKRWWLCGLVVWAAVAWFLVRPLQPCGCLRVVMLDIGQGDSFVLDMPAGQKYLVDFSRGGLVVPAYQRYFGSFNREIFQAIFTHPDLDHLGGSLALLRQYIFRQVLGSWPKHEIVEVLALEKYWSDFGFTPAQAVGPKVISLGSDISLELLWPQQDVRGVSTKNTNNQSIVFRLRYKKSAILFTGDAEAPVEKELLKQKINLQSDVLKVSHHGSKTGTSLEFLKAVSPKIALISAGLENRYGHPHTEVVKRLERADIEIYRTDKGGDVVLESDGTAWKIVKLPLWQKWQQWLIK